MYRDDLNGGPGYIPLKLEAEFAEAVARITGDLNIGSLVGAQFRYKDLGFYADHVLSASTLADALARGGRALPLIHPGCHIITAYQRDHLLISLDTHLPRVRGSCHIDAAVIFLMIDLVRNFLGCDWVPDWIEVTGLPPKSDTVLQERVGAHVRYGAPLMALAIHKSQLPAKNSTPPHTSRVIGLGDLPQLMGTAHPETMEDRVRISLHSQLASGDLTEDASACWLGIGVRTLQRTLAAEGLNFRDVKQRFLRERACTLLADSCYTVEEVARCLGYSETNSFTRAFKKWTGMPPSMFALMNSEHTL